MGRTLLSILWPSVPTSSTTSLPCVVLRRANKQHSPTQQHPQHPPQHAHQNTRLRWPWRTGCRNLVRCWPRPLFSRKVMNSGIGFSWNLSTANWPRRDPSISLRDCVWGEVLCLTKSPPNTSLLHSTANLTQFGYQNVVFCRLTVNCHLPQYLTYFCFVTVNSNLPICDGAKETEHINKNNVFYCTALSSSVIVPAEASMAASVPIGNVNCAANSWPNIAPANAGMPRGWIWTGE